MPVLAVFAHCKLQKWEVHSGYTSSKEQGTRVGTCSLSPALSRRTAAVAGPVHADSGRPGNPLEIADAGSFYRIEERVAYPGAAFFTL
jgi:hypothetical protein